MKSGPHEQAMKSTVTDTVVVALVVLTVTRMINSVVTGHVPVTLDMWSGGIPQEKSKT